MREYLYYEEMRHIHEKWTYGTVHEMKTKSSI